MEGDVSLSSLARLAAKGDQRALREIYQRTAQRLVREVLAPILASRAACEDALKETFLAVIEQRSRLADGEVLPFLATIARHKALDRRRRMACEGRLMEALSHELVRAEAALPDPEAASAAAEARSLARREVEDILSRMHPRYALALRLRLLEERERQSCADELRLSLGAFDVLFFRACKQFRALYVESYGRAGEIA